jgi:RNA polymerase sigma-70 factor (ECF subfamily)
LDLGEKLYIGVCFGVMRSYDFLTDKELVACLREGDTAAYTQIYTRHWSALYRSAYNVLRDEAMALDVLQEVFAWIWSNKERIEVDNLRAYLYAAVRFKVANALRDEKYRKGFFTVFEQLKDHDPGFNDETLEVKELKNVIAAFTDSLPEKSREVFRLSRYEQASNKEIANRLGISEKTVENHMTTTLRKLRVILGRLSAYLFFFL